jgi:hypothetical protein
MVETKGVATVGVEVGMGERVVILKLSVQPSKVGLTEKPVADAMDTSSRQG